MTDVRPEVVSLILDIDFNRSTVPALILHKDGTMFTADEVTMVRSVTPAERAAVHQYLDAITDFYAARARDGRRMCELMMRYSDDENATVSQIEPLMTAEDRAELREILDRAAPDGRLCFGSDL